MVHLRSSKRQGPRLSAKQPQGPANASSHLISGLSWHCQTPRGPDRRHHAHTCGRCAGPPSSGKVRGWGGQGGRPAARVLAPPPRSQPAGTACPTAARRKGRGPGARGALPRWPQPQRRPSPGKRRAPEPGAAARPLGLGGPAGPPPQPGPSSSPG